LSTCINLSTVCSPFYNPQGYYHESFLRGHRQLCYEIKRLKLKGQGPRKRSIPEDEPDFWQMTACGVPPAKVPFTNSTCYSIPQQPQPQQFAIPLSATNNNNNHDATTITTSRMAIHDGAGAASLSSSSSSSRSVDRQSSIISESREYQGHNNHNNGNASSYLNPFSFTYNAAMAAQFQSATTSNIASVTSGPEERAISSTVRTIPHHRTIPTTNHTMMNVYNGGTTTDVGNDGEADVSYEREMRSYLLLSSSLDHTTTSTGRGPNSAFQSGSDTTTSSSSTPSMMVAQPSTMARSETTAPNTRQSEDESLFAFPMGGNIHHPHHLSSFPFLSDNSNYNLAEYDLRDDSAIVDALLAVAPYYNFPSSGK
jgi:hypothetical protein